MEVLKGGSGFARRLRLVALALAALSAGTCTVDWWFVSYGPEWLGLVRSGFDVREAMAENLDATKADVLMVERFSQAGQERVFVLAESDRGRAVFVLDGSGLEPLAWFGGGLSEIMFQDADGAVIVGQTRIDTGLKATTVGCTVRFFPGTPPDPDIYEPLGGFGSFDGAWYRVLRPEPTLLNLFEASALAGYAMPSTPSSVLFASTGEPGAVLDIEQLSTPTGTALFVNLRIDYSTSANAGVYRFENLAALLSAPSVDSGPLVMSYPPPKDNRACWLTADGLVMLAEDASYNKSLQRLSLDASADPLDSYVLEDTEDLSFFFDPDGKHWYVFDRWHGRLYLLDTWWSE